MTVEELIELLSGFDPNRMVILQKDAEGNGYSPLNGACAGMYSADSTWSGEVGLEALDDEDRARGYTEEDVIDGERAVILNPVN